MEPLPIQIRPLSAVDAVIYREIRLEGLRSSPEAFGSTFEAESAQPLTWFSERLQRGAKMFGAFHGSRIVGVAGLFVTQGVKEAHKGHLVGMFVRPAARNTGVGQKLVEAVLNYACDCVELIQLGVVSDNQAARRLYARLGFIEYGIEKHALKQDGRYFDEVLMARNLQRDAGDPV